MAARVCRVNEVTAVFDGDTSSPAVLLVDDEDKVIRIGYAASIKRLRDFLVGVCQDIDEYKQRQKRLAAAEQRCSDCAVPGQTTHGVNEHFPYDECEGCDNLQPALEAMERYA